MHHRLSTGAAAEMPRPEPPPAGPASEPDHRWKLLTEQANAAFAAGDLAAARSGYEAALAEAERLFESAWPGRGAPPVAVIHTISCHNLAELASDAGEHEEAGRHYRRACERLLAVARSAEAPLELRLSCIHNLRQALAALARHAGTARSPEDGVDELVEQARLTALRVLHVVRHAEQARHCGHCPLS